MPDNRVTLIGAYNIVNMKYHCMCVTDIASLNQHSSVKCYRCYSHFTDGKMEDRGIGELAQGHIHSHW